MTKALRIAMVVGEVSGDTLGAALIRSFKAQNINAEFEGVGGPQMIAEGFESFYPMDSLSVMGIVEVLVHLKALFKLRDGLLEHWIKYPPDVFIGIDAPDFNLRLAKKIKDLRLPIKTVQYVSPSVWAWRQRRVLSIKYAIDLVLCLFPFEVEFYDKNKVSAIYVGHPLAQKLPLNSDSQCAKQQLSLALHQTYIALLPGSRYAEVARLLPLMLTAANTITKQHPDLQYIIPAINHERAEQIKALICQQPIALQSRIKIIENDSQQSNIGRLAMQAGDAVILASGTATLEALLLHTPMLVIYKLHWLTYWIVESLIKIPYVSLPNILAGRELVTELIQKQVTAENIYSELNRLIYTDRGTTQIQDLKRIHQSLRSEANINDPVQAILKMIR